MVRRTVSPRPPAESAYCGRRSSRSKRRRSRQVSTDPIGASVRFRPARSTPPLHPTPSIHVNTRTLVSSQTHFRRNISPGPPAQTAFYGIHAHPAKQITTVDTGKHRSLTGVYLIPAGSTHFTTTTTPHAAHRRRQHTHPYLVSGTFLSPRFTPPAGRTRLLRQTLTPQKGTTVETGKHRSHRGVRPSDSGQLRPLPHYTPRRPSTTSTHAPLSRLRHTFAVTFHPARRHKPPIAADAHPEKKHTTAETGKHRSHRGDYPIPAGSTHSHHYTPRRLSTTPTCTLASSQEIFDTFGSKKC